MSSSAKLVSSAISSARAGKGDWLRPLNSDWPSAACRALEFEAQVARVTVADIKGSAPREPGTTMLVSAERVAGTIGGGHLEWEAIRSARELLAKGASVGAARTERLVLGTQLGQCCGGVVELWVERLTRLDLPLLRSASQAVHDGEPVLMATSLSGGRVSRRVVRASTPAFLPPNLRGAAEALLEADPTDRVCFSRDVEQSAARGGAMLLERLDCSGPSLWLYGAGHVGQALVRILGELPIKVTWVDSRAELLPRALPDNVRVIHSSSPAETAMAAPAGVRHLVMTHDHALDYDLCRAILQRDDFAWLGLIGSASKGARFRSRLRRDDFPEQVVARLTCPIGVERVEGKAPAIIAISVAAQLLRAPADKWDVVEVSNSRHASHVRHVTPEQEPTNVDACTGEDCAACASAQRPHA